MDKKDLIEIVTVSGISSIGSNAFKDFTSLIKKLQKIFFNVKGNCTNTSYNAIKRRAKWNLQ